MKKIDWSILAATCAYSYLFFKQAPGLNFFLFSLIIVTLCSIRNHALLRNFYWLLCACGTLISGFAVFYYGTPLPVFANICSLFALSALSFDPETSLFISVVNVGYSYLLMIPSIGTRLFRSGGISEENKTSGKKKMLLVFLSVIISIVFILLYRASDPVFEKVTDQINFDFISFDWMLFTICGFIFSYGFFYHQRVKFLSDLDAKNPDKLAFIGEEQYRAPMALSFISSSNELFFGVVLFSLLNFILLSLNAIDIYYVFVIGKLPYGLTLSEYVHDGTDALIISIIFAVAIILFIFRGTLNFIEKNKTLKLLAYAWVVQNILMVATTANRNYFYVFNNGLTHRRLGVYVFLCLCIWGLLTAFIKVAEVKSNWFLFRKNTWAWYLTLVISCTVNWDNIIATYNLNFPKEKKSGIDYSYLAELDYTALYTLYKFSLVDEKMFKPMLLAQMKLEYQKLTDRTKKADWQSSCVMKLQIQQQIDALLKEKPLSK